MPTAELESGPSPCGCHAETAQSHHPASPEGGALQAPQTRWANVQAADCFLLCLTLALLTFPQPHLRVSRQRCPTSVSSCVTAHSWPRAMCQPWEVLASVQKSGVDDPLEETAKGRGPHRDRL